jgi:AhpC/TSA family
MLRCKPFGARVVCALLLAAVLQAGAPAEAPIDLAGRVRDPFASAAQVRVFIFVRTDCPITNRYAPELFRIAQEFAAEKPEFWLVYSDPAVTPQQIRTHMAEYGFPGQPLRDPHHDLVKRAHVTTAPEAAVFDAEGKLVYHGRIDDLWVEPGKSRAIARTHDLEDAIEAVASGRAVAQPETRAIGCSLADVK